MPIQSQLPPQVNSIIQDVVKDGSTAKLTPQHQVALHKAVASGNITDALNLSGIESPRLVAARVVSFVDNTADYLRDNPQLSPEEALSDARWPKTMQEVHEYAVQTGKPVLSSSYRSVNPATRNHIRQQLASGTDSVEMAEHRASALKDPRMSGVVSAQPGGALGSN